MKVGKRDSVVVDNAERPYPRAGQILQHRRAETSGANNQRARGFELVLTGPAQAMQHDLACVALNLFARQGHDRSSSA